MYKCCVCEEEYNFSDEVERMNCNGDTECFIEHELETNGQNPDWCVHFICDICLDIFDEVKSHMKEDYSLSSVIEVARVISKKYEDGFSELSQVDQISAFREALTSVRVERDLEIEQKMLDKYELANTLYQGFIYELNKK